MSSVEIAPLNTLPSASGYDNFSKLSDLAMSTVQQLDHESRDLTAAGDLIAKGVEGPARNGELQTADMLNSMERTMAVTLQMNDNIMRFSALSSTLTSFGNNLNSFLKGQ